MPQSLIQIIRSPFISEFVLPAVIVFSLVFVALQNTKAFEDKKISAVLSAAVALLFASVLSFADCFAKLFGYMAISLVIMLLLIILSKFAFPENYQKYVVLVLGFAILLANISIALGECGISVPEIELSLFGWIPWALIGIAFIGAIIWIISSTEPSEPQDSKPEESNKRSGDKGEDEGDSEQEEDLDEEEGDEEDLDEDDLDDEKDNRPYEDEDSDDPHPYV